MYSKCSYKKSNQSVQTLPLSSIFSSITSDQTFPEKLNKRFNCPTKWGGTEIYKLSLSTLHPPPPPPAGAVLLVAFYPYDIILFMSIKVAGWGFSGGKNLPSLSINYVAINKDMEKWPPQLY